MAELLFCDLWRVACIHDERRNGVPKSMKAAPRNIERVEDWPKPIFHHIVAPQEPPRRPRSTRLCAFFRSDFEFQKSVNAACCLQLRPRPFEQHFSDVPEFAAFLISELFHFAA
jgi:hypothetical protein